MSFRRIFKYRRQHFSYDCAPTAIANMLSWAQKRRVGKSDLEWIWKSVSCSVVIAGSDHYQVDGFLRHLPTFRGLNLEVLQNPGISDLRSRLGAGEGVILSYIFPLNGKIARHMVFIPRRIGKRVVVINCWNGASVAYVHEDNFVEALRHGSAVNPTVAYCFRRIQSK